MNKFFIFCSGVHPSYLDRSPSENNKYAGIGATVFFTGLLAFVSAFYAFYTVFNSYLLSLVMGLIWGAMIFNLDRYIVSSMKKNASGIKQFLMALPRFLFAILIALVISKPLEMKLFESEINAEIVSMEQAKYRDQELLVENRFQDKEQQLLTEIDQLKSDIKGKEIIKNQLISEAVAEADGTGGSRQKNLGPIYRLKKEKADIAVLDWERTKLNTEPIIAEKREYLDKIRDRKASVMGELQLVPLTGFASRLKALSNLSDKHQSIFIAGLFISLLFILLESAPIFVKLISPEGPLDYVQEKHESYYKYSYFLHRDRLNLSRDYTIKTKQHATVQIIQKENELINELLSSEVDKVKKEGISMVIFKKWKDSISQLFSSYST
jgi:hypothetical protein